MKKILVALLCVGLFVGCSKKVIKVEETISKPSKVEKVVTVEPKMENKVVIGNIYPKEQVKFEPIYFDFDSKTLTKEAFATLEKIAPVLNKSNSTIECGCRGNETCGAKAVKGDCCLDQSLICPCCNKLGKKENMKRWKKK